MATNSIKLLTGNSHGQLAKLVADRYADGSPAIRQKDMTDGQQAGHRASQGHGAPVFKQRI